MKSTERCRKFILPSLPFSIKICHNESAKAKLQTTEDLVMQKHMGQIIRRLRREKNLTQNELAELLGVTNQAISKWENQQGNPDISQIVPLATVLGVNTDVLFGLSGATANDEAMEIIVRADSVWTYGEPESYLEAYDILIEGLKKFPNNLMLTYRCMQRGASLSLSENDKQYLGDRAEAILSQSIKQAHFIMENAKNISDILTARQTLVFLYAANRNFELAMREAHQFPVRTDFTLYSTMAIVDEYMGNHAHAVTHLCSDIDYSLQALEDHTARLGKVYYKSGKYQEAIEVYTAFFDILKAIFQDECPPPYHDFDSGDCHLLLAQAYLALGDKKKAMDEVERSVFYYLDLCADCKEEEIPLRSELKAPLVRETELRTFLPRNILQKKLLAKLSEEAIQPLCKEERFQKLLARVNHLS